MYDQIHKIEVLEVWVDGNLTVRDEPFSLTELQTMTLEHKLPTIIAYKRRLYPRDYLRKSEVEDFVFFELQNNRVVYKPLIPNNDPTKLSHFYIQAYSFSFELRGVETLQESMCGPNANPSAATPSSTDLPQNDVRFSVIPFDTPTRPTSDRLAQVAKFQVACLNRYDKSFRAGGYKKRVHHDVVVPLDLFTTHYRRLKERYNHWVATWEESTDPSKFVFEDVGIAAFLISVWELQSPFTRPTFIDIGCGNGFLVYILTMEGYVGRGIDLTKRKIWAKYPATVRLEESIIDPSTVTYEEDWIIANHSDELTPWVPLIASKNNRSFFALPCCEFDFPGTRYTIRAHGQSRYDSYMEYIKRIGQQSGYQVEVEHLRIPSTRNIALIGKTRLIDPHNSDDVARIQAQQAQLLSKANFTLFEPRTTPTKSHVQQNKKRIKPKKFKGTLHPNNLKAAQAQASNYTTGDVEPTVQDDDANSVGSEEQKDEKLEMEVQQTPI